MEDTGGGVGVPLCGQFIELAVRREDDDADVGVAEHGELLGLLEQPGTALAEGDLALDGVLDPPQLQFAARHCWRQPPTSLD
ncbi:hypothetical protein BHE74_00041750 [Ensete ventricosum]|uniref:Uncharacterized protein n=1 Tax=Ensete ventricosum TaxID=4639 RepID=A0A426X8T9_ENSVE|nr:hypothetical protein B296_00048084 [Ensete ventricosum]RWW51867.1 hypothetical protein BHE74_00041750 [Ensete ventricosum]